MTHQGQAGEPGAEVVEGDLDPDVAQRRQPGDRGGDVGRGHAFGHLQAQSGGWQVGLGEHGGDVLDVDGDDRRAQRWTVGAQLLSPALGLRARSSQGPQTPWADQSAAFGGRDELGGADPAAARVPPAGQRLELDDGPARQGDLGLVVQLELIR